MWGLANTWAEIAAEQRKKKKKVPERVYMEQGSVAHVLTHGSHPDSNDAAMCGRAPWPGLWRGTGSRAEREKAKSLRLCVGCRAVFTKMVAHK